MNRPMVNNARPASTKTPTPATLVAVAFIRASVAASASPASFRTHERLDERVVARVETRERSVRHQPALVQEAKTVANHARARDVVGDDDERGAAAFGVEQKVVDLSRRDWVET